MNKELEKNNIMLIKKMTDILLIAFITIFLNCTISPSFIRNPEVLKTTMETKALLCASFNASINNAKYKFDKKLGVSINLKDLTLNKTIDLEIASIDTLKDKILYIPINPGRYQLTMIQLYKLFTDIPTEATFTGYKWKWRPAVIFKQNDVVNIKSGEIIYIGSYDIVGDVKKIDYEDHYLLTSFAIHDNFDNAKQDLSSILGQNETQMKKKLNLLDDIAKLDYVLIK